MAKGKLHIHSVKSASCKAGFTLVELSIVLVIIGLIISSVLVGQDLVRSAELRAAITQYEGYNAAAATYRGKYGALPGDSLGKDNFGFTCNGNGDGTLSTSSDLAAGSTAAGGAVTGENVAFWHHLGSTGAALISGSYDCLAVLSTTIGATLPATKAGNYWGVYTASGVNYYILGVLGSGVSGTYLSTNTLTPLEAQSTDAKIDDGIPNKGFVQAKAAHASNPDTDVAAGAGYKATRATSADAVCASGTSGATLSVAVAPLYNTSRTDSQCTMRFKLPL